jgi:nitroreductase
MSEVPIMSNTEKDIFDAIYARRSIRAYQERDVEREKIEKLLKAAMAAPSACNLQPWEFIVVTEKDLLKQLKGTLGEGNYNAPVAMVICGNPTNIPWDGDGWMQDCSAAVENMMIAAPTLGLGSVWIGGFDSDALTALLNIPAHVHPMCVVLFGYPAQEKTPRTKYNEEAVFWQTYDPERKRQMRTIDMKFES